MSAPHVFFVATAHPEYAERGFPKGSVVIDPWRIVPDREGVTVRRLGENKPARISILCPSRARPESFVRMAASAHKTALFPNRVEFVCRLDFDDPRLDDYFQPQLAGVKYIQGPRELLSMCWNRCADLASGEILMHAGDDLTFNTNGWDQRIREAFASVPDRILFVYGNDLSPNFPDLGTHGFVHRRWVEAVGYFLPPLFSSDWNDVWLTDVAMKIGRALPLEEVVIEHHHYTFGKAERDQTHAEREERGRRDDVVGLYNATGEQRERDAGKLREAIR